jgi:hypothetical protein
VNTATAVSIQDGTGPKAGHCGGDAVDLDTRRVRLPVAATIGQGSAGRGTRREATGTAYATMTIENMGSPGKPTAIDCESRVTDTNSGSAG